MSSRAFGSAMEKDYKSINLDKLSYILSISENFNDFKKNINDILDNYNSINHSSDLNYKKRMYLKTIYNSTINGYLSIHSFIRSMTNNDLDEMNKHIDNTSEEELRNKIKNYNLIKKKNITNFRNLSL